MSALALDYRPQRFDEVVGQYAVKFPLRKMVERGNVPTGLLFAGVRGTGKTTTARILAAAVNCQNLSVGEPCGACVSCKSIFGGSSLDVHEIDAASHGNVAAVRSILDMLRYEVGATKRLVLFDEAHSLSSEAFNALLKTLEEPPPDTLFVLLTTEPNKIMRTVLSRLMTYEFVQISVTDIEERLKYIAATEQMDVHPDLITLIANRAQGGMRDAVMMLDHVHRIGVRTVEAYRFLTGAVDFAPDVVRWMSLGDVAHVFDMVDTQLSRSGDAAAVANAIISCLRDVIVLHGGGILRMDGMADAARRSLLSSVSPACALAGLQIFWALKTETRVSDDPRSMLDMALTIAMDKMTNGLAAKFPSATAPVMNMSQIEAIVSGGRISA